MPRQSSGRLRSDRFRGENGGRVQFIKDVVRNLALLLILGVVLFLIFPDMMRQVLSLYGALFGPLIVVILIVAALRRRKSRRP